MKFFLLSLLVLVIVLLCALLRITGSPATDAVAHELPQTALPELDVPHELSGVATADDREQRRVDARKSQQRRVEIERNIDGFAKREEAREPAPGSLFGRIVDPLRCDPPRGGGTLVLHFEAPEPGSAEDRSGARRSRNDVRADVFTSGEYEVKDLELGTWTASCRIAGCPPLAARIVLARGAERAYHEFVFDPNRVLRVALRDTDGRPLLRQLKQDGSALAKLLGPYAWAAEPSLGESAGASGKSLAFRSNVLGQGDGETWCQLTIEASPRELLWVGVVLGDRTLAYRDVPPGADEIVLRVGLDDVHRVLGSVEITVVDDWSSLPLSNAGVMLPSSAGRQKSATTDEHGRATFDSVLPGEVRAVVGAEGYVNAKQMVFIDPGTITKCEARLEPAVRITGRFVEEDGSPRALGVQAIPVGGPVLKRIEREGRRFPDASTFVHAVVRRDRTFVFEGLSHGAYVVIDGAAGISMNEIERWTKDSVPPGAAFVDAHAGSVSGVVLKASKIQPDHEQVELPVSITGRKTQQR